MRPLPHSPVERAVWLVVAAVGLWLVSMLLLLSFDGGRYGAAGGACVETPYPAGERPSCVEVRP